MSTVFYMNKVMYPAPNYTTFLWECASVWPPHEFLYSELTDINKKFLH